MLLNSITNFDLMYKVQMRDFEEQYLQKVEQHHQKLGNLQNMTQVLQQK